MSKSRAFEPSAAGARKRVALYARVSSEEQTRGNYPSCTSQVEELEAACRARGWEAYRVIKDEGYSAGSLKRPGLSELRWLVQNGEIEAVACTWYDRLTRSRDFYTLDREFKEHGVEFVTLHDPTDRNTASGRFLETMLVAAKTYEREQTGEKVRTKMRMRAEKGMWNGGHVPFGFLRDAQSQVLVPDKEKASLVRQMFQTYVDTRSDSAVRDWLKARQIPAPNGNAVWSVGTLRELLCNRRYIGDIEINPNNKARLDVPEPDAYRIIKMAHEPIVERELWDAAQAIRHEKAGEFPNNPGTVRKQGRAYSWGKNQRVYLLQGLLTCAVCDSLMTPHYVFHKAGKGRTKECYIHHYVCTKHRKYGTSCDHRNRVLARIAEAWVLERVRDLATTPDVLEAALDIALQNSEQNLQPVSEELTRTRAGLQETQKQIDALMSALTSGPVTPALMQMVNERAGKLNQQKETLLADQRRLLIQLAPLEHKPSTARLRAVLSSFSTLMAEAEPTEVQRLLRLLVRRLGWSADGVRKLQLHNLAPTSGRSKDDSKSGSNDSKLFKDVMQISPEELSRFDNTAMRGVLQPENTNRPASLKRAGLRLALVLALLFNSTRVQVAQRFASHR